MSIPEHQPGDSGHWLDEVFHHVAHHLPDQGPIHVFVHHNTLHALQHLPFHDALMAAHQMHGGPGYRPPAFYRGEYARGRINDSDLKEALQRTLGDKANEQIGPLKLAEIYRLVMVHGIEHQTVSSLHFALHEAHEHLRLRKDLPSGVAQSLRQEQLSYCRNVLGGIGKNKTFGEAVMLLSGEPVIETALQRYPAAKPFGSAAQAARAFGVSEAFAKVFIERAGQLCDDSSKALAFLAAEYAICDEVLADIFGIAPTLAELSKLIERGDDRIVASSLWGAIRKVAHRDYEPRPTDELLARVGIDRTHIEALAAFVVKDPRELVTAELIPLCAAFLDDGSAAISMPHREKGFLEAVRHFYCDTKMPLPTWADPLPAKLAKERASKLNSFEIIERRLDELGVSKAHAESYLRRLLLHLPGWSGMFQRLERKPDEIRFGKRPVKLADFAAVKMTMDACAMEWAARTFLRYKGALRGLVPMLKKKGVPPAHDPKHKLHDAFFAFQLCKLAGISAAQIDEELVASLTQCLDQINDWTQSRIYQEAYEIHYYREVVGGLLANARREGSIQKVDRPVLQVITCIDEREESFRRHMEEAFPETETFGAAGFFGLPIAYKGLDDAERAPLCPVVVTPAHAINEIAKEGQEEVARVRALRRSTIGRMHWSIEHLSQGGIGAALLSPLFGLAALAAMACRMIAPKVTEHLIEFVEETSIPRPETELSPTREGDIKTDGLWEGFSLNEEVDRVAALLRNIGLVRNFAPVVAVLGHGSHCLNNPHFSAHDCGACGGRPGYPNARLFARAANKPEVRDRLRQMDIDIPADTVFIGGLHNTASDDIVLAPIEGMTLKNESLKRNLEEAKQRMNRAAMLSAHERCRRFEAAPHSPTPEQAFAHVQRRSADFGQPRPELGHMTNASCVVGRRSLSRGVFLDRRAFLVSYDPSIDPDVALLERILAAVGPVGAGISLEYYFSTTDNLHYGCGTKLPHNPASNLGVMEGAIGDLRTGLPKQMIEFHEPMRLLLVVEATTEALLHVVGRQPEVAELVKNAWVIVVSIHPETREAFEFIPGRGFVPFSLGDPKPPKRVPNSMVWYHGREIAEHLPVALVESPARSTHAA